MFNCPLDNLQTETKGTVLLKSAEELKQFTKTEENMLRDAVQSVKDSGATVVGMFQNYLLKPGKMDVISKMFLKEDRVCAANKI